MHYPTAELERVVDFALDFAPIYLSRSEVKSPTRIGKSTFFVRLHELLSSLLPARCRPRPTQHNAPNEYWGRVNAIFGQAS